MTKNVSVVWDVVHVLSSWRVDRRSKEPDTLGIASLTDEVGDVVIISHLSTSNQALLNRALCMH